MPQMQLAIQEAKLSSVRQFPEGYRQQTPLILQMALAADAVLALAGLTKGERIAGYKVLFFADARIQRTTDSVNAAAQMEADVDFPVTVSF